MEGGHGVLVWLIMMIGAAVPGKESNSNNSD